MNVLYCSVANQRMVTLHDALHQTNSAAQIDCVVAFQQIFTPDQHGSEGRGWWGALAMLVHMVDE